VAQEWSDEAKASSTLISGICPGQKYATIMSLALAYSPFRNFSLVNNKQKNGNSSILFQQGPMGFAEDGLIGRSQTTFYKRGY
jgi:hypothetical protein